MRTCVAFSWWIQVRSFSCNLFVRHTYMMEMGSLYHFYCILGNTTTIEGWEKDKVATLIRRGKIRAIKFPYVRDCSSTALPLVLTILRRN